jgi:putative phosphoesterase
MKIAVFADSHGELSSMESAITEYSPGMVIHLGDFSSDAHKLQKIFPQLPFLVVQGNCDIYPTDKTSEMLELGSMMALVTHGHKYEVRLDLLNIEYAAREMGAHGAIFGHTHEAVYKVKNGITLFNPGAIGGYGPSSWGQIEITDGRPSFKIITLD